MSSTIQDRPVAKTQRRFCLHALSWFVLIFVTTAVVIIVVPGSQSHSVELVRDRIPADGEIFFTGAIIPNPNPHLADVATWSHGWPLEYLRRPFDFDGAAIELNGNMVVWSTHRAWRFWGAHYSFNVSYLVIDVLIGLAIVAAAVGACELWRRRRRSFRFSLLDTAMAATICCGILGWWQYHTHTTAREQQIRNAMIRRGSLSGSTGPRRAWVDDDYHGPGWLARLVGGQYGIPFCFHIDKLDLDTTLLTPADYSDLCELRYVESVHLTGKLNKGLANAFAALPALRTLDGLATAYGGYPGATMPEPMIAGEDFLLLQRLPRVRFLKLGICEATPAELLYLARRPNLEFLQIWDADLLVEDIQPLTRSQTLKKLDVSICATYEEQEAFNARHPNLDIKWDTGSIDGPDDPGVREAVKEAVCDALFKHWQKEDHYANDEARCTSFLGIEMIQDDEAPENDPLHKITRLDFSEVRLSRKRLDRIPIKSFPDVDSVTLGLVDSVDTAMQLLRRCGPLRELDARYVPLTMEGLRTLSLQQPENWLYLQQGSLTVDDFCQIARTFKPQLVIYGSSFTPADAERIQSCGAPFLDVYKHFDEDDADSIYPVSFDSSGENPFK